ncbi:hypothetical protein FRC10_005292, partial [Ceratobasidium sp. 414]
MALPFGKSVMEDDPRVNSVPYITTALKPSPNSYTRTTVGMVVRSFIVSSGIQDAITGAKP